jgi:hypothetical protein
MRTFGTAIVLLKWETNRRCTIRATSICAFGAAIVMLKCNQWYKVRNVQTVHKVCDEDAHVWHSDVTVNNDGKK